MTNPILVAGGAGFIGAHLCRALLAQGHLVTALDDFSTGDRHALASCIDEPNFTLVQHDITEPLHGLSDRFTRIYNLACPASPRHYQRDPVKTLRVNVQGSLHLLELARDIGARILQASTSEIYGDPLVHPQTEQYLGNVNPIGARACYDEGKRCAETLFFDYHRQYGVDIKVARIFNTYGPHMRQDDGRVISNFICQALAGQPLTLYGDGEQTRSFCYIDDMVDGLIRLMESEHSVTGPINLGNDDEYSIAELAEKILELTGGEQALDLRPLPQDDPLQRQPDITLAKALLDWEPKTGLDWGLSKTIAYFRGIL